ncbi:Immediate early response 3-interacting protein 1 [Characodon lateralis]|uniref:Immediate early response 3-interacting protein 1 n=2 Tax=Goodeidae TaxID=28758 RepID=A0ABU7F4I5_9TELE|nr:Immediate early response 3-interacting protein 1 [Characodon lateralis]
MRITDERERRPPEHIFPPSATVLCVIAILCINAVAVLHEERFLSKIGWGVDQSVGGFGDEPGIKVQLMNLIRSVRTVMRVPLIGVNSVCIVLLLLFG